MRNRSTVLKLENGPKGFRLNSDSCLALAVTSDGNIDQLGDGDDGDLGVQDDAENVGLGNSYR